MSLAHRNQNDATSLAGNLQNYVIKLRCTSTISLAYPQLKTAWTWIKI